MSVFDEQDIVDSPDDASISLEHTFHDARDPEKKVVMTAHQLNSGVVALNLWLLEKGKWRKILKEETRPAPCSPEMLMGIYIRWMRDEQLKGWANRLVHWSKAQQSIFTQIMKLFVQPAS